MTLHFLNEGETIYIKGSGKKPYEVKKVGGIVSCSCPAWRNLGGTIDTRVCKHIKVNIDPGCLLPQALASVGFAGVSLPGHKSPTAGLLGTPFVLNGQAGVVYHSPACGINPAHHGVPRAGIGVPMTIALNQPRLTKTGKVSTAVGGAVVKDTAPPLLLAHKWDGIEDPKGWWVSEKLDGVRAWWDGTQFISRLGNIYHAPEWFKSIIPKGVVLDGELWVGRGKFQQTISTVRKLVPSDQEWLDVTYVLFDAPEHPGTFEERQAFLTKLCPTLRLEGGEGIGQIAVVEQTKCTGVESLKKLLAKVEKLGAEGLMLRQPGSLYEEGRSNSCLKVKSFIDDEAVVKGYTQGKGKHKGRVGALEVEWNGQEFEVGTGLKDKDRVSPPAIGSRITFRYFELTQKGIPRFPSFIGVRDYE